MKRAFYYDIVCPYAYMAFSFLRTSENFRTTGMELKPILLGGLFKYLKTSTDPNKVMAKVKADYVRADIVRQAQYFGVPLRFHPRHPVSTLGAMRLLHACDQAQRESMSDVLYRAYWQDNLDIDDDLVLQKIAKDFGIGGPESYHEHAKQRLIDATKEAFDNKVFGVPTIALNDRLYFGGDRLQLIAEELGLKLPDAQWQASDEPIDFYFDFSSPYSYLAWVEIKKAQSFGVKVNFIPVLLGAIFKEIGTLDIPMLNAHPFKTAYYFQDMVDWAGYRSAPFFFNSHFPLRSVMPLRIALINQGAIEPIFRAAWACDQDIGDKAVLISILNQAGIDGETLVRQSEDERIKDQLKTNTACAVGRGVFGVPTFYVKGEKIFGQDRFSWIRRRLGGR